MKKLFIFTLILIAIPQLTLSCAKWPSYKLIKYNENSNFEYLFHDDANISIDNKLYPGIKIYVDNNLLDPSPYVNDDKSTYYLGEKYSSEYFPPKINVSVIQNGVEIYSAKWKIKNVTYSMLNKLSPFLFAVSLLITATSFVFALIGTFLKKFSFAKKILIFSIITDLIFVFIYFSGSC